MNESVRIYSIKRYLRFFYFMLQHVCICIRRRLGITSSCDFFIPIMNRYECYFIPACVRLILFCLQQMRVFICISTYVCIYGWTPLLSSLVERLIVNLCTSQNIKCFYCAANFFPLILTLLHSTRFLIYSFFFFFCWSSFHIS